MNTCATVYISHDVAATIAALQQWGKELWNEAAEKYFRRMWKDLNSQIRGSELYSAPDTTWPETLLEHYRYLAAQFGKEE